MKRKIYCAIIPLIFLAVFAEDHKYCTLPSCPNRTHTLCKYPEPGAASTCNNISLRRLTRDEKITILNIYNSNSPTATLYEVSENSEMRAVRSNRRTLEYRMLWDRELEMIAQRWADQCIHMVDECRNTDRFNVRQRVHLDKSATFTPIVNPLISQWLSEDRLPNIHNLIFEGLSIEQTIISASNYFSRLMRRNENRIGCGAIRTFDNYYEYLYLVCNYGIQALQNN